MSTIIMATSDLSICETANRKNAVTDETAKSGHDNVKDNPYELCVQLADAQSSAKTLTKTGKLKTLYRVKAETILQGENGEPRSVWATPDNLHCIDTWKKFDPECKFLLVYVSPQNLIADAFINRLSSTQIKEQLASWAQYHDAMLKIYRKNKADCILLSNQTYSACGKEVSEAIRKRFNVPDVLIEGEQSSESSKYISLMALMSGKVIPGEKAAFKLWEKLEKESFLNSDRLWELSNFDLMTELFNEWDSMQTSNQRLVEQHTQEKNLLKSIASAGREEMRNIFLAVPDQGGAEVKAPSSQNKAPSPQKTKLQSLAPKRTSKPLIATDITEQRRPDIKIGDLNLEGLDIRLFPSKRSLLIAVKHLSATNFEYRDVSFQYCIGQLGREVLINSNAGPMNEVEHFFLPSKGRKTVLLSRFLDSFDVYGPAAKDEKVCAELLLAHEMLNKVETWLPFLSQSEQTFLEQFLKNVPGKKVARHSHLNEAHSNVQIFGYEIGQNYEHVQCKMTLLKLKNRKFHDLFFQIQKLDSGYFLKLQRKHIHFLATESDFVLYALSGLKKTISGIPKKGEKNALRSLLTSVEAFLTKPEKGEYVTESEQMFVQDAHIEYVKTMSRFQRLRNRI